MHIYIGLDGEYNDEIMSFLANQGINIQGNMDENNFQNLGGGPDLSSVMFDGFPNNNTNSSSNSNNNSGNNHLF